MHIEPATADDLPMVVVLLGDARLPLVGGRLPSPWVWACRWGG
jgi:hypothetical protein